MTELESLLPEIEEAIGRMVQHYAQVEPLIGRHIHIDGTEAETHSRFIHACTDEDHCAWRREGETAEDVNRRVLGATTTALAQKQRQDEDAGDVEGEAQESTLDVKVVAEATPGNISGDRQRPQYRVKTSNHVWLTHDPDAGFRSYVRPNGKQEGWHGYYHVRMVDDFTGLTLYGHAASSSRTENSLYNEMLRGALRTMNPPGKRGRLDDQTVGIAEALAGAGACLPEAITADRGFGYPFIYEQNTRLGIQTVTPLRKFPGRPVDEEVVVTGRDGIPFIVDRHGVIHCKHCGGPTKRVELRRARGENPRIYVTCLLPAATDSPCGKLQSIPCDLDWVLLTELARNDEKYLALEGRFQYERTHNLGRVRNRNGAKDAILRPKRLGRAWQQLLLHLGNMVDWLRAGIRHGWIEETFGGYPKTVADGMKERRRRLDAQVRKRADALRALRRETGLDSCIARPQPKRPPP